MRKSFLLVVGIAVSIVAFDVHLASFFPISVNISTASAQELPSFTSTSTLVAATSSAWLAPLAIEKVPEKSPRIPDTKSVKSAGAVLPEAPSSAAPPRAPVQPRPRNTSPVAEIPVRIIIPSIGLDTSIDQMGINAKGEMDVPPGDSTHVGWYKGGPKPGQRGSSVMDAHVFAAFENLKYLKVGEDIIVETVSGQRLRFVAEESTVFRLSELTSGMLFGRGGDRWLNLITCAGEPVGDTYSHRLIVYSTFVEVL